MSYLMNIPGSCERENLAFLILLISGSSPRLEAVRKSAFSNIDLSKCASIKSQLSNFDSVRSHSVKSISCNCEFLKMVFLIFFLKKGKR